MATSEPTHHECPRCNESIFFDEELQICDKCEWGLDDETCACDPAEIDFTADLESDQDCKNAVHTLLTRLKQLKAETPDKVIRTSIEVRDVAQLPRNDEDDF